MDFFNRFLVTMETEKNPKTTKTVELHLIPTPILMFGKLSLIIIKNYALFRN